jgi:GNAT superfamily N-acetyltransferase
MCGRTPIPLTPHLIELHDEEFGAISSWPFVDDYIGRLLREDIPQRVQFGHCRIWVFRDPEERLVGFGTIDHCDDYAALTGGLWHPYIPLLAINPTIQSRGYGTSIVRFLIDEAALMAFSPRARDEALFLDVYCTNHKAIDVYKSCGFVQIGDPISDPLNKNTPYIVMAQRVSIATLPEKSDDISPSSSS